MTSPLSARPAARRPRGVAFPRRAAFVHAPRGSAGVPPLWARGKKARASSASVRVSTTVVTHPRAGRDSPRPPPAATPSGTASAGGRRWDSPVPPAAAVKRIPPSARVAAPRAPPVNRGGGAAARLPRRRRCRRHRHRPHHGGSRPRQSRGTCSTAAAAAAARARLGRPPPSRPTTGVARGSRVDRLPIACPPPPAAPPHARTGQTQRGGCGAGVWAFEWPRSRPALLPSAMVGGGSASSPPCSTGSSLQWTGVVLVQHSLRVATGLEHGASDQ